MTKKNQENELTTITEASIEMEITLKDGSKKTVTLRRVPLRSIAKLSFLADDPVGTAKIYLGEEQGKMVDSIDDFSIVEILEKGDEINAPLYEKWRDRQYKRMKQEGVKLEELVDKALESARSSSTS